MREYAHRALEHVQAAKSIRELAEKISNESLRISFLASPPVLRVLQYEHALPQTADPS